MFSKRGLSCVLGIVMVPISTLYGQDKRTFSMPESVLLFAYPGGELRVVAPNRTQVLEAPVQVPGNKGRFNYPSISRRGDLIAWGFAREGYPRPTRFALGIYSIADQRWSTYGDFDDIGATAFSPDDSKVAFVAVEPVKGYGLLIFDVATKSMTRAVHPKGIPERASLSWSPDGTQLVVEIQRLGKPSLIAVLDPRTGEVKPVGEGSQPAWSPTGEWIAYYDPSGEKCMLVHPDGNGAKTVSKVGGSFFTVRGYSYAAVWSPDGKKLLLNESRGRYRAIDVALLELETGRTTTKTKNGLASFGWVFREK